MTRGRLLAVAAAGVALVAVGGFVLAVGDDRPVRELPPGRHSGLVLDEPVVLRAAEGAVVEGPLEIVADDVTLDGVVVEGGRTGISVRGAEDVVLRGVAVHGAMYGIDANDSSVRITDCTVTGVPLDGGQGIEVRNSLLRPRSVVEGCRVEGGREGIVSHVARVEFRHNQVTGTAMRGIAVTEMSEGLVEANAVAGGVGVGLFCGDMSHCEVRGNEVRDIAADPAGIRGRSGQAVVAWYYSTIRVGENTFAVERTEPVDVYRGSVAVERFPLSHWPAGWQGAVPGLGVTAVALGALVVARLGAGPVIARWQRRGMGAAPSARARSIGRDLLIAVGVVQLLHVGEHLVQIHQVKVADAEVRTGLAGQHFDTEWLHLAFNGVVLAGIVVGGWLVRHELAGRLRAAGVWLLGAAAIQTWHVSEHVVRVVQYLGNGVSPAPGIVGDDLGLVWFHFGINIPVMAGMMVAGAVALAAHRRRAERPHGILGFLLST